MDAARDRAAALQARVAEGIDPLRRRLAPRGLHLSGLSDRELDVLRLVAEKGDHPEAAEIARQIDRLEQHASRAAVDGKAP